MSMSNRNFAILCGLVTVVGIAVIVAASQRWNDRSDSQANASSSDTDEISAVAKQDPHSGPSLEELAKRVTKLPENTSKPLDPGKAPLVPGDQNNSTKAVLESLEKKNHSERLSPYLSPAPFDETKFLADPESYLAAIEPGRIYQSAQPGKNVPRIKITSKAFSNVVQGEKVFFQVKVNAGDPVTFHSSEMGEFANRLSTITVRADDAGIAKAEFKTTPGMHGLVNVLAASPRTSGQAHFYVNVSLTDNRPAKRTSIQQDSLSANTN